MVRWVELHTWLCAVVAAIAGDGCTLVEQKLPSVGTWQICHHGGSMKFRELCDCLNEQDQIVLIIEGVGCNSMESCAIAFAFGNVKGSAAI